MSISNENNYGSLVNKSHTTTSSIPPSTTSSSDFTSASKSKVKKASQHLENNQTHSSKPLTRIIHPTPTPEASRTRRLSTETLNPHTSSQNLSMESTADNVDSVANKTLSEVSDITAPKIKQATLLKRFSDKVNKWVLLFAKYTRIGSNQTIFKVIMKDLSVSNDHTNAILDLQPLVKLSVLIEMIDDPALSTQKRKAIVSSLVKASHDYQTAPKDGNGNLETLVYSKKRYVNKQIERYPFVITRDNHLILSFDKFASGTFKTVKDARDVTNGDELVKATIKDKARNNKSSGHVAESIQERELQAELASGNPNLHQANSVVKLIKSTSTINGKTGLAQKSQKKHIFFEKRLEGSGKDLNLRNIKSIFRATFDMFNGLEGLHKKGHIHSDLKPANLLLKNRKKGHIVIADFGMAVPVGQKIIGGTNFYKAPEILQGNKIATPAHDAYAAGMIMLDFLVGEKRLDSIIKNIMPEVIVDGKKVSPGINRMNNEQRQLLVLEIKDEIRFMKISKKEKQQRQAYLNVALGLIDPDPKTRWSIMKAYIQLRKVAP